MRTVPSPDFTFTPILTKVGEIVIQYSQKTESFYRHFGTVFDSFASDLSTGTYVLIHTISGGVDELLELSNLDPWHGCKPALCINHHGLLLVILHLTCSVSYDDVY